MEADRIDQKVVVIRLPANFQAKPSLPPVAGANQGQGPQLTDINQIPDEIIAEMVSNQYKRDQSDNIDTIDDDGIHPNMMIDNSDPKQLAMYSLDHPELASSTAPAELSRHEHNRPPPSQGGYHITYSRAANNSAAGHNDATSNTSAMNPMNTGHREAGQADDSTGKEDETIQYKNYSPKQREWMLVVLSYSRGLLAKPFEMKLQDVVIEKAREVLRENAPTFKMTNRIPTPKTLRGIWKNLWKHPERTVGTVKKGGRPRIDPAIKRQKRNEREKRRRAALRQSKQMGICQTGGGSAGGDGAGAGADYYQMDQQPATPRRSQRGQ